MSDAWSELERDLRGCSACKRLARWRVDAAERAPRAVRGSKYWSSPVPGFGDRRARILVLGLAPGAHGANRTGRPFTGDGAGPFLYGALHAAGLASSAISSSRDDGLVLRGARITNAVRCAPPGNRPTPREIERCFSFVQRELDLARDVRVILCLGAIAWASALRLLREHGAELPVPKPRFGHGAELDLGASWPALVGSFHPSQLNTRTGRLTAPMFARVVRRAQELADRPRSR
jgi:uracil-DNA glycosylase family 4